MLQVAVKKLPGRPCRPGELLQTHAAEMLAVDIKLLERDAAGIQLVGVQEMLEPLPHLILGPVLRMDFMPLASEKPTGNCKRGGSPVSELCLFLSMIPDKGGAPPEVTGIAAEVCMHQQTLDLERRLWEMQFLP